MSKIELPINGISISDVTKLPTVTSGRSSLVASPSLAKAHNYTHREIAGNWALELRTRIKENIDCHEDVNEDDIMMLKKELIAVFITTLQTDSRKQWSVFVEILTLLEPYKEFFDYFETKAEFHHYLERVLYHIELHKEKLFDLHIERNLIRVFPEHVRQLKSKGLTPSKNYCNIPPPIQGLGTPSSVIDIRQRDAVPPKSHMYPRNLLPDGTNPYTSYIPTDKELIGVKGLTMRDISKSMGAVALEMAARESIWNHTLGTTALALATDLPEEEKETTQDEPSPARQSLNALQLTSRKEKTPRPVPNMQEEVLVMNGREAVQYFTSCYHMGQIKSLYLNLAKNRHYRPYDLISVPKSKANPEHYVFSTFGVLHVYPDQVSESLTLAEWQREAVLWNAISSIPFFKNYLIRKAFHRWKSNHQYTEFQRRQRQVLTNLLSAMPPFGAALLQISRLLKELLTVPFLPTDTDKTYELGEFENSINYKNIQADQFLARFFKYCKMVVDFTSDEAFKKLRHCEEQLRKKTYFSKDSLSLQRMKKEEREKNLANAKQETCFLGNFVKLVDQLIVEHMFEITKTQTIFFVQKILTAGLDMPREGFFMANLVFSKECELTIFPSKERFVKALESTLGNISSVLTSRAISLDWWNQDRESLDGNTTTRSNTLKSPKLSQTMSHRDARSGQTSGNSTSLDGKSVENEPLTARSTVQPDTSPSERSLSFPNLTQQALPSKEMDEMGVATPDLVIMHTEDEALMVEGEGFVGQYEPLSKANLEEKLLADQEYQEALKKQGELMESAFSDIDLYCQSNKWLTEIQKYCHSWNGESSQEYKAAAGFVIEQKLTELRMWSDRVRNFDRNYVTENGMFYLDCSAIHDGLLPRLNDICQELVTFVADQANILAHDLVEEMTIILKNMSDKKTDVMSFASLAKNFTNYKKNTVQYQQRVEYIKSLYEVIRMSYRQLTPEEEKWEEKIWTCWEAFLMQMQDTSEFVSTQTPLMLSQLEANFQRLRKEATAQAELATSGKFLDPTQNPVTILAEMKGIREKFFSIQGKLQEVSVCREAISGEPYNLKFLYEMSNKMDMRQDLWKYVEVTTNTIKGWKQMQFRKINIKKALEKISVWETAASRLTSQLPPGDQVLAAWVSQVEEFRKHLPILSKLAHDSLQERHWHSIFLGLNLPYDPNHQLTVKELISYNLADHADLIHSIYMGAIAEDNVDQRLQNIISFWQERQFQLAKYIPDSLFTKEQTKRITSGNVRTSKLERYRQERAAAQAGVQRGLDIANDDFYILIEVDELKYYLEDSRLTVDSMMASPHEGDKKDQVEFWCQALREIDEITDLWLECQKKWQYLLKIFEQPELYNKLSQQAFKFEAVHNKFKDWMRVSSNDSKCMSVVNRRRGDRGYRLLQGDNLRILFQSLIKEQEEILKDIDVFIEKARSSFHRLYFLSNDEVVGMLAVTRNPQALLPYVRKCFPSVNSMTFALPPAAGGLQTQLDLSLNSDKLEVVSVQGSHGEELPLYTRVEPVSSAPKWLSNLNQVLKNTLTIALKACVQARIEEGTRQPILVLEELAKLAKGTSLPKQEEIDKEIKSTFCHWLLRFPVQSVITAEAIIWERGMNKALDRQDKEELRSLKTMLCSKLDQLVDVMQESQTYPGIAGYDRQRLEILISGLLIQGIYQRDLMKGLLDSNQITDSAFDWLKILKFRMDIRNVLRAKTVVTEIPPDTNTRTPRRIPATRRKRDKAPDPPKLTRTQTTVSNDYQFSTCYVQQLGHVFTYDYEYLGPCTHLVLTPLTERAFLTMGHALKTFQCGTLIGPNGSGKTEIIRELAKLMGRCMFTISCSEIITLPVMLQYMMGMVQSGCWALFDDTDRLTTGLMSVTGQQLDYLKTALRTLDLTSENQYQIRGHSHFDKVFAMKAGMGDKMIRRNSLTTLHPLPKPEEQMTPAMERQRTVPHGFNEKGLVTYFEDTWVAERDQRRHSIEREIKIKESDLYKTNKPPPLFYEHVKANRRRSQPDFSKLTSEPSYRHRMLGNVMFNGKLLQASSNFGCFMTLDASNPASLEIPYNFRLLMRPCALIVPDIEHIVSVYLQSYGFKEHNSLASKMVLLFKHLEAQLWRHQQPMINIRKMKQVLYLGSAKRMDAVYQEKIEKSELDASQKKSQLSSVETEEESLVFAIRELLTPGTVSDADLTMFLDIVRQIFPNTASQSINENSNLFDQKVKSAVLEIFTEDHMESNEMFCNKIIELYTSLETSNTVILSGQPGSGKTKAYHTLSRALNMLNYKAYSTTQTKAEPESQNFVPTCYKSNLQILSGNPGQDFAKYPKIDVVHLFPGAMTPVQLLGSFEDGVWQCGLLEKVLRDSYTMCQATAAFIQSMSGQEKKNTKYQPEVPSVLKRWVVLDGHLDPCWTDGLKTFLDNEKRLSLGSGEGVLLKDLTNIIFETTDLRSASPAMVARCTVIHLAPGSTNWSSLYYNWKQTAARKWLLTAEGLKMLDEMTQDVFPPTIKFLTQTCQTALLTDVGREATTANSVTPGVSETSAFISIFSALLDRVMNREEVEKKVRREAPSTIVKEDSTTPKFRNVSSCLTNTSQIEAVFPNYQEILKNMFAFAYIWAFGGHLHDRYKDSFSKFAHDALYRSTHPVQLPISGHVYDYYIDEKTSGFAKWSERQQQDRIKNLAGFYVTPEVDRYAYLLELLMSANQPVLLAGAPGVGKSSLVRSMVLSKTSSTMVNMSKGLSSSVLQDLILAHVQAIQNKNFARVGGAAGTQDHSRHLFFLDDLNMAPSIGGYQPPLELMRSILTTGGMHDKQRKLFHRTREAAFIAATTTPSAPGTGLGLACHVMFSRLTRCFVNLTVFTPSEDALVTLFSRPLQTWLEEFPTYSVEHHTEFARAMCQALLELHQCVKEKLRPSPSQSHYIFSLHDINKVVQGMLLMSPRTHIKKGKTKKKGEKGHIRGSDPESSAPMMKVIAQLWCHEVSRNFGDRILHSEDQLWFTQTVESVVLKYFCSPRENVKQEMTMIEEDHISTPALVAPADNVSQLQQAIEKIEVKDVPQADIAVNPMSYTKDKRLDEDRKSRTSSRSTSSRDVKDKDTGDEDGSESRANESERNTENDNTDDEKSASRQTSNDRGSDFEESDESDSDSSSELSASAASEAYGSLSETSKSSPVAVNLHSIDSSNKVNNPKKISIQSHISTASGETSGGKSQDSTAVKRGVTFKAGLIADKKHVTFCGPLLSIEEIKGSVETLTDFIFSKFYMGCHTEAQGLPAEKGYTQYSEEKLSEALQSCLAKYNKGTSQRIDLVFFKEAVHHAARLSRVLAHPKGHALLLGMSYCTGRATLTRLAAYVAHCKLFEAKAQSLPAHNLNVLRKHIKLSSYHAGIVGKPTVLLVHEDLGEEGLYDVSAVMAEGTAPGLYSEAEVQDIVGHLMPGGVQTKKVEKIEQAFDRYVKRIRQNLHVIVLLNYKGNNFSTNVNGLHDKLQRHPGLLKNSFSVDIYMPWSFKSLAQVARTWLQDTKSGVVVPWNPSRSTEQLDAASNAMAYIHLSAKAAVDHQFCHQKDPLRIFTPLTFLEFVHLFKIVAAFLVKTEKAKGSKYEQALDKINEAFGSIAEFKKEVSGLMPQHTSAAGQISDLVSQVESFKQDYIKALEQCKVQEETITQLQGPLESLRQSAQTEFDKVNPIYQAAAKVLDNLDINAVEELRSYPSPPEAVKFVMKALCLLFEKPQTWEAAKSLMVDSSFFQELIFYNKDNIPKHIFKELKKFINDPLFVPEVVAQASSAASSICSWIHAVYAYSSIQRKMRPHMRDLMEAETKFTKAQAQLGHLRVEAQHIKTNLEQYINQHKEAIKVSKAIEKQIQAVERRIARANNLMDNMSMQHFLWRSELKKTRRHIVCAPGDALMTAACVAYHGPLDDKSRLDLMQDWLDHIRQNRVDAQAYQERDPYSVTARLELLMDVVPQSVGDQSIDPVQGLNKSSTYQSDGSSTMPSYPQVKTFKYMSAVYDSSKYYKSELKKQDTMESILPEQDMMDDDDDEDENTVLPTRPNLTLQDILSDFDELSDWRMQNLPTDLHSVQNALMMRVCCHNRKHCWPLLIDPDNQAEMWVKALHKSHNIFTQKDVADFVTEEDIPIEEANFSNDKEGEFLEPPPSRGTMLTFSDVTESGLACSQDNSLREITSRSGVSQRTSDSEELRPVTSVTNSWDSYSLHADSEVDMPDSNLLVLVADDANINSRLINAIVHGVTVLITHIERKPLDSLFRGLLLKQFYVDKEGNKIVRVGDMSFNYHPNFCLYLSTSVPLFVKGDGLYSFPLNRVSVINMAVSDEAIINHLMFETMQVEKKEFEGQRRSNENDIILHRQRLAREHEIIREKTLNLTGPLLEDKTMLDSLLVCQTNVEHNRQMLQETRYMGDHLEGKFSHYTPFIKHSAMLYNVLGKMSVLYPCYYLPFYKFVDMFASIIKSRDRGKGSLGAPQVRAQELSDAVLHGIFRYARLMMFEKHYNLLALIVALERMLRQRKVSNKELSLFVNGFQKLGLDDASLAEQKPGWMKVTAWIDCSILESLHHPFHGLCQSLVNNSQQWREYFQHPISLLNQVPGDTLQELSFFQKCLLWKLVCPNKFYELSQAITLYELGSAVDAPDNYDIREVYTYTNKHTPTMFILPSSEETLATDGTQGIPFVNPAQEIIRLAREIGMEGRVRILNFGVSSQMSDVYQAIEDCLQTGHWLILQNYQLADDLDTEFFSLLKDIIYSKWIIEDNAADLQNGGRSLVARSSQSRSKLVAAKIQDTFRLWITTKADGKRIMPGLLMQHGLRVTCEVTGNFRSLLWKAYKSTAFLLNTRSANGEQLVQRFNRVMPLALLHAIILQQSYFGRHAFVNQYFWTIADMAAAVDILQGLTRWSTDAEDISSLIADFYTGHCLDLTDAQSVEAVVKDLALHATHACKFLSSECGGAAQLLFKLSAVVKETNDLQRTIDSIEDTSARTYCLPGDVEELQMKNSSRIFLKELVQATGAPELLLYTMSNTSSLKPDPTCIITTLLGHLAACPMLPNTSVDQIMPLDAFFCQEVMGYKELLQMIESDLTLIKRAVSGEISLTANMSAILESICHDRVPTSWLTSTFPTSPSVDLWLKELPTRMNYVNYCMAKCPLALSLHMFLRPDRLFQVVRQAFAQKNFKVIHEVTLEYQVMPREFEPSQKPDEGVFIEGLELKNASWDSTKSALTDTRSCSGVANNLPVLWVKPKISGNMKETVDAGKNFYMCPLYSARHSELHCNQNKIWTIPLASAEPTVLWAQKRTVLTLKSD